MQAARIVLWGWLFAWSVVFTGCGDDQAPVILDVSFPADTSDTIGPYLVEAVVEDNWGVHEVDLLMTLALDQAYDRLRMSNMGENHYEVSFGNLTTGTTAFLIVEAKDADGNRSRYPDLEGEQEGCLVSGQLCWYCFEIFEKK